jgi:hypothetical protein
MAKKKPAPTTDNDDAPAPDVTHLRARVNIPGSMVGQPWRVARGTVFAVMPDLVEILLSTGYAEIV